MKYKISTIIFLILVLSGCNRVCIFELDSSAGLNGSFEKIKHGLPLNWYIYAPDYYKKGYDLIYDTIDAKDGKQSLKFIVKEIDSTDEKWKKPGFFGSTDTITGDKFNVSFWIKNRGCDFKVKVTSYGKSTYSKEIVRTKESFEKWKYFEYKYIVPESVNNVKFELNIFSTGTFWIDDVKIEKIKPEMINSEL